MYGELACLGRHTVTGMLVASGSQFADWSGAYRLFSKQRVDVPKIMNVVQSNVLQETDRLPYVVAHMEDTAIKKTGKRIPGTAWRRDPLGPPFQTNLIWGQRFIQMSLALPGDGQIGQSRAIPVVWLVAPGKPQSKCKTKHVMLPRPKWYPKQDEKRVTTDDLLNNLRAQLWAKATGMNFSGFVDKLVIEPCPKNTVPSFSSAPFYMRN